MTKFIVSDGENKNYDLIINFSQKNKQIKSVSDLCSMLETVLLMICKNVNIYAYVWSK